MDYIMIFGMIIRFICFFYFFSNIMHFGLFHESNRWLENYSINDMIITFKGNYHELFSDRLLMIIESLKFAKV